MQKKFGGLLRDFEKLEFIGFGICLDVYRKGEEIKDHFF